MNFYFLLIVFVLSGFYPKLIKAQVLENEPTCIHIIKKSNPSPIINYLISKYGVIKTESILIRKANYETENNVIVLFGKTYIETVKQLDELIANEFNQDIINDLKLRKSTVINFSEIENQLIK